MCISSFHYFHCIVIVHSYWFSCESNEITFVCGWMIEKLWYLFSAHIRSRVAAIHFLWTYFGVFLSKFLWKPNLLSNLSGFNILRPPVTSTNIFKLTSALIAMCGVIVKQKCKHRNKRILWINLLKQFKTILKTIFIS